MMLTFVAKDARLLFLEAPSVPSHCGRVFALQMCLRSHYD